MQKAIWKFELEITDIQALAMPQGAEILTAQMQGETLCLWAAVQPYDNGVEMRTIELFGTGHLFDEDEKRRYIATAQMAGGRLVWHVFELLA